MRRKRKDALDKALESIHERTPRIFAQYCAPCSQEVRGEPMWWVSCWKYGEPEKMWVCKKCAPTILDLVRVESRLFAGVDFSPLIDDEAHRKREKSLEPYSADV